MTHEEIRKRHFERLNNYHHSAEYAEYAKEIGGEVPQGGLPSLLGNRWEIDAEIYHEFLGMLPPLEWRNGAFYMSEFTFDNITAKFSKDGDKYYCEFARYPSREASRPEEAKEDARWPALSHDIRSSLRTIEEIDAGMGAWTRSAFVNSIAGKVERLAMAGEVSLVEQAVALVREYNDHHKKPAIGTKHKFWTFAVLAKEKAGIHAATATRPCANLWAAEIERAGEERGR